MDLISQVMNNIDVAIENGVSQDDFREDMINTIENQWGLTPKPNRLDMIFRNNVLNAYNEGRQQIIDEARDTHPYLRFDAVLDDRTTVICRTCNGVVLPANHSWWNTHTPLMHHQCRSILVPLTEAEAIAHGITANPPTIEPEDGFGLKPDQQLDLYLDKKEGIRNPILSGLTTLSSMGLPDFWLFDESKIKRDERGRFASKSGAEHASETEKFLEKRVKARKPVELGKHIKEVSGDGQEHHEAILGQFHKLGLSPLLRKFPIENMHISKSLEYKDKEGKVRNPNGIYSHEKGQLKIKIPRDEKSFG
jgi:SPP1 gp7 family putative phage head morphogenesis protein